ncbi:MAG: hypothetical protein DCC68_01315 [Planctomycetota bacterium]|nr:MAG: hypothetical protein DCC68_01315 [Planctomycetota bacterium]
MAQPSEKKIDELLATIAELKDDLNKLRDDFLNHEHGTAYNAMTLRMYSVGTTVTPSGGTSTAIAGNVPSKMFQV